MKTTKEQLPRCEPKKDFLLSVSELHYDNPHRFFTLSGLDKIWDLDIGHVRQDDIKNINSGQDYSVGNLRNLTFKHAQALHDFIITTQKEIAGNLKLDAECVNISLLSNSVTGHFFHTDATAPNSKNLKIIIPIKGPGTLFLSTNYAIEYKKLWEQRNNQIKNNESFLEGITQTGGLPKTILQSKYVERIKPCQAVVFFEGQAIHSAPDQILGATRLCVCFRIHERYLLSDFKEYSMSEARSSEKNNRHVFTVKPEDNAGLNTIASAVATELAATIKVQAAFRKYVIKENSPSSLLEVATDVTVYSSTRHML